MIYTGGTLGMVPDADGLLVPGADVPGFLTSLVRERGLDLDLDLHTFEHLIDSSNATPEQWEAIAEQIRVGADDVDGFVVLHGTDTTAYTSAALAYALTDVRVPVVLTGAQLSIVEPGSDGPDNAAGALIAAATPGWSGVAVHFDGLLLSGPRASKVSSYAMRGFDSPMVPPLGRVESGRLTWQATPEGGVGWPDPKPYRHRDVVVVSFAPGMTADRLAALLTPAPEAVLVRSYGVGGGPDEEPGIADVLAATVAAGVPVAVASQCPQANVDLARYAVGGFLEDCGAAGVVDATVEAAYAKLVFLLCQGVAPKDFPRWLATNIAGEITPGGRPVGEAAPALG